MCCPHFFILFAERFERGYSLYKTDCKNELNIKRDFVPTTRYEASGFKL